MVVNILAIVDDAKCYEVVRSLRWPEGVQAGQPPHQLAGLGPGQRAEVVRGNPVEHPAGQHDRIAAGHEQTGVRAQARPAVNERGQLRVGELAGGGAGHPALIGVAHVLLSLVQHQEHADGRQDKPFDHRQLVAPIPLRLTELISDPRQRVAVIRLPTQAYHP